MSTFVTSNFIRKRGIEVLFKFQDMLNEGKHLDDIGRYLGVSAARVNVLRNKMFLRKYTLRTHVETYLHHYINIMDGNTADVKRRLGYSDKPNIIDFKTNELHRA